MIVKRVTQALRQQDWAAVAIEFLLVVAGVLLAFQINEWASEHEARAERQAASERLLAEAEETVAFFRVGVAAQRQLIGDLSYALDMAQQGKSQSADRTRMTLGLSRAMEATTPSPPSSVYDDLVSSGTLGEMGDPELRSAIARYRAALLFHTQTVDYLRQRMPKLEKYEAFQFVFDSAQPRPTTLKVDFGALERDAALQEKLAMVADWQNVALVLRERNLKRAQEMCREIGRVAGRPCDLQRAQKSFD